MNIFSPVANVVPAKLPLLILTAVFTALFSGLIVWALGQDWSITLLVFAIIFNWASCRLDWWPTHTHMTTLFSNLVAMFGERLVLIYAAAVFAMLAVGQSLGYNALFGGLLFVYAIADIMLLIEFEPKLDNPRH